MRFNSHRAAGAMLVVVAIAGATTLAGCSAGSDPDAVTIRVAMDGPWALEAWTRRMFGPSVSGIPV